MELPQSTVKGATLLVLFVTTMFWSGPSSASWWGKKVAPAGSKAGKAIEEAAKDVEKTVKEAGSDIEKTTKTAYDQIHDGTVHAGHQTATNFRSVSEWVDVQMKSFCEAMGPDEDCVEDGIAVQAKSDGTVSTSNQKTGDQYTVVEHSSTVETASVPTPTIVIMQPGSGLQTNQNLQRIAVDVAGNPLEKWSLAYPKLSESVRVDNNLQTLWNSVVDNQMAAVNAQNSGKPRPIVQVLAGGPPDAENAVKTAYDAYQSANDVWDVLMEAHRFNWVTAVASDVLSPEQISKDPPTKFVPGLYPEEEAALKAADAYYKALPADVRLKHEANLNAAPKNNDSTMSSKP